MHGADGRAGLLQPAGDVHQAAGVAGHHGLGAAGDDIAHLAFHHRLADRRIDDAEDPAKTAAGLFLFERHQLQAVHGAQQALGFFAQPQAAQPVAGGVVGDPLGEARPDVGDAELVDQVLAELEGAPGQVQGQAVLGAAGREQRRVVVANHIDARTGRRDDRGGVAAEGLQPGFGQAAGVVLEAAVEQRLAAAGLGGRKARFDAQAFQQRDHLLQHAGVELLAQAGDK